MQVTAAPSELLLLKYLLQVAGVVHVYCCKQLHPLISQYSGNDTHIAPLCIKTDI